MATQKLSKAIAPCVLEVERKFTSLAVPTITQHGGNPPFRSLRSLPIKTIRDIYFDKADVLCSNGAWVRKRNGAWQAKIRKGGDFTNSRFQELTSVSDITACVCRITGTDASEANNFGMETMAEFTTTREMWIADGEFRIVRDRMDFGHEVGEIELEETLEGSAGAQLPTEEEKLAKMQQMDERIADFMRRYSWAFARGKPTGKLMEYLQRRRPSPKCG